jgi:hypothetical protein
VAASQVPSGFWRIGSTLAVSLDLTSAGFSGGDDSDTSLPLGVDDNEEFPLDLTVETKPLFAVGEPLMGFSETRGVCEALGGEPKVETTVLVVCWLLLPSTQSPMAAGDQQPIAWL